MKTWLLDLAGVLGFSSIMAALWWLTPVILLVPIRLVTASLGAFWA